MHQISAKKQLIVALNFTIGLDQFLTAQSAKKDALK